MQRAERPRQRDLVDDLMDLQARLMQEQENVRKITARALWMEQTLRRNGAHANNRS